MVVVLISTLTQLKIRLLSRAPGITTALTSACA